MQTGAQHLSPRGDEYTNEPKNMVSSETHFCYGLGSLSRTSPAEISVI